MKLYDLDRGDKFKLAGDDNSPVFTLETLDGMYSICHMEKDLHPYHFAGYTPVIRVENE